MNLRKLFIVGLILVLVGFGAVSVFAKTIKIVKVDLKNRQFEGSLPFDEKFHIIGGIDDDIQRVVLIYSIDKPKKNRNYYFFTKKDCKYSKSVHWDRDKGGYLKEDQFKLTIGPLHPKVTYKFKFKLYRKVKEDDKIVKDIFDILKDELGSFKVKDIRNHCAVKKVTSKITKRIVTLFTKKSIEFFNENGDPVKWEMDPKGYFEIFKNFPNKNTSISNRKKKLVALHRIFSCYGYIFNNFYEILDQPNLLSAHFREVWNKPLNSSIEGFKSTRMSEVARIIFDDISCLTPEIKRKWLTEVLEGKARIVGNNIFPANELDINSIRLLLDFFKKVKSKLFTYKVGGKYIHVLDNEINKKKLPGKKQINKVLIDIVEKSEKVIVLTDEINQYPKKIDKSMNAFAKVLLKESYFADNYQFKSDVEVIETLKENSYFSIDLGIGHAYHPKITFLYTGVNFYFAPINKRASLKIYKGWDQLLKRFSLLVGLTSSKLELEGGANKDLLSSGNIVFGGGLRIVKSLKANAGLLFFKQVDQNPLNEDTKVKAAFFYSVSFDIGIKSLLDKIGNLF